MAKLLADLQSYVESLLTEHQIPAVSLAVWHQHQCYQAAAGILNQDTGVQATPDSIFQIGSITKVFTACLVMQLVETDRVELDRPVKYYLQDFTIADTHASQTITVRQLLNHSSGIAGDFCPDDSNAQGNAIARYLDRINLLPLVHAPGAQFSYSNAAFVVAGRLVEVLFGLPWHQAIAERIFQPLGITHAIADPKESLRYRAAIGHYPDADNPSLWCTAPRSYFSPALAPAGSTLSMSAAALLTFGRAQLERNKTNTESPWLSPDSLQLMQTPSVALPATSQIFTRYWGLGWGIWEDTRSGTASLYHSGQSNGQTSLLQLFPEQGTAIAVLLNSAKPGVVEAIVRNLTKELIHIDSREPDPCPVILDTNVLQRYAGVFESFDAVYQVSLKPGDSNKDSDMLAVSRTDKLHKTSTSFEWRPLGDDLFAAYTEQGLNLSNVVFMDGNERDVPQQLFVGGRVNRRVT